MMYTLALLIALLPFLGTHLRDFETPLVRSVRPIQTIEQPTGIPPIDCIYVVNLSHQSERFTRIQTLFQKHGLTVTRVLGVNGQALSYSKYREFSGPYSFHMYAADYGWLLSYLSVLKDAQRRGFELIWICQDTVDVCADLTGIPALLKTLFAHDPKWDLLFTDIGPRVALSDTVAHLRTWKYDPRPDQTLTPYSYYLQHEPITDDLVRIYSRVGMHSTILSKRGIEKILRHYAHSFAWSPLETDLHTIEDLHTYATTKDLVSNAITPTFETPFEEEKSSNLAVFSLEEEKRERERAFNEAQTLYQQGNLEEALKSYKKRVAYGGEREEVFWSLYQIGRIYQSLGRGEALVVDSYTKAYHRAKERQEPLYRLAELYRTRREYNLAYLIANVGAQLAQPEHRTYAEEWIYEWGMLLELSLCAYYANRLDEFQNASKKLLKNPSLPAHVRSCVEDNLKLYSILH